MESAKQLASNDKAYGERLIQGLKNDKSPSKPTQDKGDGE